MSADVSRSSFLALTLAPRPLPLAEPGAPVTPLPCPGTPEACPGLDVGLAVEGPKRASPKAWKKPMADWPPLAPAPALPPDTLAPLPATEAGPAEGARPLPLPSPLPDPLALLLARPPLWLRPLCCPADCAAAGPFPAVAGGVACGAEAGAGEGEAVDPTPLTPWAVPEKRDSAGCGCDGVCAWDFDCD